MTIFSSFRVYLFSDADANQSFCLNVSPALIISVIDSFHENSPHSERKRMASALENYILVKMMPFGSCIGTFHILLYYLPISSLRTQSPAYAPERSDAFTCVPGPIAAIVMKALETTPPAPYRFPIGSPPLCSRICI